MDQKGGIDLPIQFINPTLIEMGNGVLWIILDGAGSRSYNLNTNRYFDFSRIILQDITDPIESITVSSEGNRVAPSSDHGRINIYNVSGNPDGAFSCNVVTEINHAPWLSNKILDLGFSDVDGRLWVARRKGGVHQLPIFSTSGEWVEFMSKKLLSLTDKEKSLIGIDINEN